MIEIGPNLTFALYWVPMVVAFMFGIYLIARS